MKTAIVETLGPEKCDVVFNLVPKQHAMSDIYCQLIPNEDDNDPYYQVMPRMGAFEVSVNGCVSNQQNYLLRVENALPVSQFKLRVQKRTIFFYYAFGHDFLILAFII